MKKFPVLVFVAIIFLTNCEKQPTASQEYLQEIKDWDQKRAERLKADNGWLNLVGRTWLKPGENKFGSAKGNDVVTIRLLNEVR